MLSSANRLSCKWDFFPCCALQHLISCTTHLVILRVRLFHPSFLLVSSKKPRCHVLQSQISLALNYVLESLSVCSADTRGGKAVDSRIEFVFFTFPIRFSFWWLIRAVLHLFLYFVPPLVLYTLFYPNKYAMALGCSTPYFLVWSPDPIRRRSQFYEDNFLTSTRYPFSHISVIIIISPLLYYTAAVQWSKKWWKPPILG